MKETYRLMATQIGIEWRGRRYDRARPMANDAPNQALNHAASAVEAAAAISVSATATLPQLSSGSFMRIPGSRSCWMLPICFVTRSRFLWRSGLQRGSLMPLERTSSA